MEERKTESRFTWDLRGASLALLARLDAWMNRLYGWGGNPLYRSGSIVVGLLLVLLVTGLYLLLFYRIGAPWESMARLDGQAWSGRWIRSLHRFAADAAVVAAAVHAFRMFAQGRSWGPRALAWISGLILVGVLSVCGWTGYVMVWDVQARVLAVEGARLLDALPLFSEPIGRAFVGERPLPAAFFFLNLFLHIALPVGMGILLWLHVSRIARPALLPPRRAGLVLLAGLVALSVAWPVGLAERADPMVLPDAAPFDLFYAFWLPLARALPAWALWAIGSAVALGLLLVPLLTRPRRSRGARVAPAPTRREEASALERAALVAEDGPTLPSVVDERLCTGCEQCWLDCPYEAIRMVPREDGRTGLVARVEPDLCVSCGICAGSCAPMGVGPPGRTGRDQLATVRAFLGRKPAAGWPVVVVGCSRGAVGGALGLDADAVPPLTPAGPLATVGSLATFGSLAPGKREGTGPPVLALPCAGNLHSSVVEMLLRRGAGGVLVATCPPRDCWNREGVNWLEARLFEGREAELQDRVDRRRVRVVHAARGEDGRLLREVDAFRREILALDRLGPDTRDFEPDTECERAPSLQGAGEVRP